MSISNNRVKQMSSNIIRTIQNLLRDSYTYNGGFTILKELIQNANDAHAPNFKILFNDGIKNASHPLLKLPAILIYDDGDFTEDNEIGIADIAGENKTDDDTKIGRYGLGMKSVFHLCDLFFYAGYRENESGEITFVIGAVNPWKVEARPEYAEFTEDDVTLFQKAIPSECFEKKKGFLLWLPAKEIKPEIQNYNISEQKVDSKNPFGTPFLLKNQFSYIISLLSEVSPKVTPPKPSIEHIVYRHNSDTIEVNISKNKTNTVECVYNKETEESKFHVYKAQLSDFAEDIFSNLKECKYWDKSNKDTNPEVTFLLMKTPKKDKSVPSKVQFHFCVYLPLEEPDIITQEVDLDEDYTFLIHANFSVDAGRKGPKGYDDRAFEKGIRPFDELYNYVDAQIEWNKLIIQQILFPSIPVFFDELVKSDFIDTLHCEKLLKTFFSFVVEKCPLRNEHLTKEFGFAKFYEPTKNEYIKEYSAIDLEKEKYIYLPDTTASSLPIIFENLANITSRLVCNCEDENFILPEYNPSIEEINQLIDSISVHALCNKENIKVLGAFFRVNKDIIRAHEETEQKIINKLKSCLINLDYNNQLYANRESLKNLFVQLNEIFDKTSKFRICSVGAKGKTTEGIDEKDYYQFWEKESKFIFVPGFIEIPKFSLKDEIFGENNKDFLINGEDSPCAFFSKDIDGSKHYPFLSGVLVSYKEINDDIAFEMISLYGNLCMFEAMPVGDRGHPQYFSLTQLQRLSSLNCIYSRDIDYVRSDNVVAIKAQFMPYVVDFYITKKLIKSLADKDVEAREPTASNVIYSILNSDKNYLEQSYNTEFLNDFLKQILGKCQITTNEEFRLIKFFLGKCKQEYLEKDLYCFDSTCHAAWKKIFATIEPEAIFIDGFEGKEVNSFIENNKEKLSIKLLTNRIVLSKLEDYEKLSSKNLDFFNTDSYYHSEEIQEVIFKEFSTDDRSLYLKIPLHKNSANNEYIAADENTYLNTEKIEFPENFYFTSKIINLCSNPILRERQEALFDDDRKLTHRTAINILFKQGQFSKVDYSDWIFNQISHVPNVDFISANEIGLNPWIPTKISANFVSLRQIIPSSISISSEIRKILETVFDMVSEYDLKISQNNKEDILDKKIFSKLTIDYFLEEISSMVSKTIFERPYFSSIDEMVEQCSIFKNYEAEPLYNLLFLLANEESIGKNSVYEHLYNKLNVQGKPTYKSLIDKLAYITDNTDAGDDKALIIYKSILQKIVTEFSSEFSFKDIKIPVKAKKYKKASEVAASNSDIITDDYLCIASVYSIISGLFIQSVNKNDDKKEKEEIDPDKPALRDNSDIELINKIFEPWFKNLKQSKLLYLFFYLLKENFKKIALDNLDIKDLDVLLNDYQFEELRNRNTYWMSDYTKKEAFEDTGCRGIFRVRIYLPSEGSLTIHSVTGDLVTVELKSSDNTNSLAIEDFYNPLTNEYKLKLAKISGETKDLDTKLQGLITNVLKNAYFQHNDEAIQKMLSNFTQSDQITIQVAQNEIFDHIDYILKEYSVKNDTFKKLKQDLKNLSTEESKKLITNDDRIKAKEDLIKKFIKKIKEDKIFQEEIHDAVVRKIKEQQYNEDSILFELLQNADDSVNDLVLCNQDVSKRRNIEIHTVDTSSTKRIYFSHFGRLINKQYSNLDISEELKEKFASDLQNMLSLNFSDKLDGNDTGKFGLGFKSIYLVCLDPIVRSGELQFEIKGALYPVNYSPDQYDPKIDLTETCIGLRLKKGYEIETVIKSFRKLASIQTLFCKQINQINIDGKTYGYKILSKDENESIRKVNCNDNHFIIFSGKIGKHNFSICFMLNEEDEIYAMTESDLVKIWNVTPLESCEAEKKLPFIINGDFQVDTGRKQLSGDTSNNRILLNKIANTFVNTLVAAKENDKSIITDKIFDGILDILLTTANVQSEIFREFGRNCLSLIKNKTCLIPNGDGKSIPYSSKIMYFAPNTFGFESSADKKISEFFNALEYAFKAAGKEVNIVLRTVYECFKDECVSWTLINKLDGIIYQIWPDKDLTNDMIMNFISITRTLPKSPKINTDWSYYRLKNSKGKWNSITSYHFNDIYINTILSDYSREVIEFLRDNISVAASQGTSHEDNQSDASDDDAIPFNSVYQLWKEEEDWEDKVDTYYSNLYPDTLDYKNLKSELELPNQIEKNQIPEKWCLFMLTAICQSIPSFDHTDITNKKAIDTLYNDKIMKLFVEGKSLNEVYDAFLEKNKGVEQTNDYYERSIRQFEMLLRLYQIRKNFEKFHSLLASLCEREKPLKRISEFLVTWTDAELDGADFDLTATDRTFKMGIHMMIRDLLRCGFWNGQDPKQIENLKRFAYMPKAVFKNYYGKYKISSEEIRLRLEEEFDDEKFLDCYDLPFLIYKKDI